jgi:hypothetical protein
VRTSIATLCLGALTLLAGARGAQAKEQFPRDIASHLNAPVAPPCGICHEYGKTGGDTLVTPFAWAMRARGLSGQGNSLNDALDRMRADAVDSDGDSVTDINELIAGTDPNSAASTPPATGLVRDPQLGCTVVGGTGRDARGGWALFLGWALAAVRRRKSARRDNRRFPPGTQRPPSKP